MSQRLAPSPNGQPALQARLARVHGLLEQRQTVSAELELRALVSEQPQCAEAWLLLAELADWRGDEAQALSLARRAHDTDPADVRASLLLAQNLLRADRLPEGVATLERLVARHPTDFVGWLALGEALERMGRIDLASSARYQGLTRGQKAGFLLSTETTPPAWRPQIKDIIAQVNLAAESCVSDGLAHLRNQFGPDDLRRVEHAMAVYQGRAQDAPRSAHQAPKFLYFPGLPEGPYHDPFLHPWAQNLLDGYEAIRTEALDVLDAQVGLEGFLKFQPGQSKAEYLGGAGADPAWDAFFFYRHGKIYADNHQRCPATSAVLKSADLCHVQAQAPEICFSVLQPGTHIMPHHGVTNTRLVMHLPLLVPPECALNVHGGGEHAWRERELVMFDDTYRHEAWNRSGQTRVVLLMDCWNPHLTPVERIAVKHLVEQIGAFENYAPVYSSAS
ncbi:MAG TPA: aspartyl/asparaginyl beta-hydroxylase domain-containing protein [Roseateles sp.]|uniref:aspartyl/asparaginyl beta-hydroxylase domain-containing protein n=1 Tax=Roseateles sp. TaxID=1971397 RepID=UPI002EDA1E58